MTGVHPLAVLYAPNVLRGQQVKRRGELPDQAYERDGSGQAAAPRPSRVGSDP